MERWKCYRVWMKDDYAMLVNATSEAHAREQAIEQTKKDCFGAAMTKAERRTALTVARVDCLTKDADAMEVA